MSKGTTKKTWWEQLRIFINRNTSLIIIIAAALLLELTTGVLFYASQHIIQRTVNRLIQREMNAISLRIRNKLIKVEVTLDNMSWVVTDDAADPDSLMATTRHLVTHNPDILGCAILCVPDLYPQKGRWYEPYSIRRPDGTIESMQLGSASHDYTKFEFFTEPIAKGRGHWSEPYVDNEGAKGRVTTYAVPVRDGSGRIVAVAEADISLEWLNAVIKEGIVYESTRRFLITGNYNLLAGEKTPILETALKHLKADSDKTGNIMLYDEHGRKKHIYFTPVGGKSGWMLINLIDDGDVYSKLRRIRMALLLPLMIGLLFAGIIVYRSSRNLERLHKLNEEKNRISGELRVASQIQQSMLPQGDFKGEGVELRGMLMPAREVGGDLYDYFIRDEKLFFCIGDVSGKGAASALFMAVCHALFRSASAHHNNPARIMHKINEVVCQGNETNIFVTLFVGVLDLPTGRLRYCCAGHDAPFIIQKEAEAQLLEGAPHLPVGVFEDTKYSTQQITLHPDSTIFLYTDGLTEARSMERKLFGLGRVEAVLNDCADNHPEEILKKETEAIRDFAKDAEQSDDLTMLVIKYTPKQFESKLTETLLLKNNVREVTRFSSFIKSTTEKMGLEQSLARQLRLAVEEAVVNVIDYAYPAGTEGDITVKAMSDGHSLHFQIIDAGVPFDPTEKEKANTTLSAEDRQIGGMGILLVRELMDSINYERIDGKNVLTLIKHIKS